MKKIFLTGIVAGILSAITGIAYQNIYQKALLVEFAKVINGGAIIGSCMIGCMLIAVGYALLMKYIKQSFTIWYNLFVVLLSFVSIVGVFTFKLPLDIEHPELFAGLVIPMHFFPALYYFALTPIINK